MAERKSHLSAIRLKSLQSHFATLQDFSLIPSQPIARDFTRDMSSPSKEWANLPSYDELPHFHEYPGCAWSVWGLDAQLGTVNLLTPEVVKRAASAEIR